MIAFYQDVQMGQRASTVSINIIANARTDLLENFVKMVRKRYSYRILRYQCGETYPVYAVDTSPFGLIQEGVV